MIPGVMFPETNAVRLTMPFNLLVPGLKAHGGLKVILVLVLFQSKWGGAWVEYNKVIIAKITLHFIGKELEPTLAI